MKKLLLLLLLFQSFICQQAFSKDWIVVSKENIQYLPLMEAMKANSNQKLEVSALTYPSDYFYGLRLIHDGRGLSNGYYFPVNTGMSNKKSELFLLDCETEKCLMKGTIDFDWFVDGDFLSLAPILNLKSYSFETNSNAKSTRDIVETVLGNYIFIELQPRYIDKDLIWLGHDKSLEVRLKWDSRSEQRSYLTECYEEPNAITGKYSTCSKLKVYGEISYDFGVFIIEAHKIEKVD
jgi:hypothetical protein